MAIGDIAKAKCSKNSLLSGCAASCIVGPTQETCVFSGFHTETSIASQEFSGTNYKIIYTEINISLL